MKSNSNIPAHTLSSVTAIEQLNAMSSSEIPPRRESSDSGIYEDDEENQMEVTELQPLSRQPSSNYSMNVPTPDLEEALKEFYFDNFNFSGFNEEMTVPNANENVQPKTTQELLQNYFEDPNCMEQLRKFLESQIQNHLTSTGAILTSSKSADELKNMLTKDSFKDFLDLLKQTLTRQYLSKDVNANQANTLNMTQNIPENHVHEQTSESQSVSENRNYYVVLQVPDFRDKNSELTLNHQVPNGAVSVSNQADAIEQEQVRNQEDDGISTDKISQNIINMITSEISLNCLNTTNQKKTAELIKAVSKKIFAKLFTRTEIIEGSLNGTEKDNLGRSVKVKKYDPAKICTVARFVAWMKSKSETEANSLQNFETFEKNVSNQNTTGLDKTEMKQCRGAISSYSYNLKNKQKEKKTLGLDQKSKVIKKNKQTKKGK